MTPVGATPCFSASDWGRISSDLRLLENRIVSLTLVTDPFGDFTRESLEEIFHRVRHYKNHLISDLFQSPDTFVSRHHLREWRLAKRVVEVETCERPVDQLDDFEAFYSDLITRHGIKGNSGVFSRRVRDSIFAPGGGAVSGATRGSGCRRTLVVRAGRRGIQSPAASSEQGYRSRAGFALYGHALRWFANRVRYLDLGHRIRPGRCPNRWFD